MELRRSGLIPLNPAGEPIIVADHPDQRHAARTKRLLSVHDRACWMAVGQIRTPGNLGTLMRSACAAAGTHAASS